jgi:hypothetical protein
MTAPNTAIRSVNQRIIHASSIAVMSTFTVLEFLDKLNVWRTESHAVINVETALFRIVKINASLNTITALLSLAQLAVSM